MTSISTKKLPVQAPRRRKSTASPHTTDTTESGSPVAQDSRAWKTSPTRTGHATTSDRKTASKSSPKTEPVPPPVQADSEPILSPPPIDVDAKPLVPATWIERLRRLQQHVVSSPYFSWSVAAYVQVLLLVILGALVLSPITKDEPLEITVSFSNPLPPVDEEEAEVVIAPPEVIPEPEPEPEVPTPELPEEPEEEPIEKIEPKRVTPAQVEAASKVEQSEPPQGKTQPEAPPNEPPPKPVSEKPAPPTPQIRPSPPHATVVGAFSAWTEPEFPAPGDAYVIVIQVTLPERIKRYSSGDLSGVIIGADGYRKYIRGHKAHFLPIVHHTARLRIPVIGAERARQDNIIIQSRILRQRQLIQLSYQ